MLPVILVGEGMGEGLQILTNITEMSSYAPKAQLDCGSKPKNEVKFKFIYYRTLTEDQFTPLPKKKPSHFLLDGFSFFIDILFL